jgi:excisionase family DNA binding protein
MLAQKLNLTRRQIYDLVRENRLPVIRLTKRKLLFDEDHVEAALRRAETPVIEGQDTLVTASNR